MKRVESALRRTLPRGFVEVQRPRDAEIQFLHVIDRVNLNTMGQQDVVIQYCLHTSAHPSPMEWQHVWDRAMTTWSYYDLSGYIPSHKFYHSPLGIDSVFRRTTPAALASHRDPYLVTTGYVTGPGAEAIEEVWNVAERMGIPGTHFGPKNVQGSSRFVPKNWRQLERVSDDVVATTMSSASHVVALRHTEGFELPAAEGIACGARAILFDQPTLRHWYGDSAIYLPECDGSRLELALQIALEVSIGHRYYDLAARRQLLDTMDWDKITTGLWDMVVRNYWGG